MLATPICLRPHFQIQDGSFVKANTLQQSDGERDTGICFASDLLGMPYPSGYASGFFERASAEFAGAPSDLK